MKQVVYNKTRTTVKLFRRTAAQTGCGHRMIEDGVAEIYFETSIEFDGLLHLARRAHGNKKKSACDGPLSVRIIEERKL